MADRFQKIALGLADAGAGASAGASTALAAGAGKSLLSRGTGMLSKGLRIAGPAMTVAGGIAGMNTKSGAEVPGGALFRQLAKTAAPGFFAQNADHLLDLAGLGTLAAAPAYDMLAPKDFKEKHPHLEHGLDLAGLGVLAGIPLRHLLKSGM